MRRLLPISSTIIFFLFCWFTAFSQFIVSTEKVSYQPVRTGEEMSVLKDVLSELETTFDVSIMYNSELVDGITVRKSGYVSNSIEKRLGETLNSTGLKFKKIGQKFFVITKMSKEQPKALVKNGYVPPENPAIEKLATIRTVDTQRKYALAKITGRVTDASNGESLPGVSIIIKGTATGTITDFDGNYNLDADVGQVLIFSFVGFSSEEVTVGSNPVIDVSLSPDIKALQEVVVVGYGTQQRRDITGSVTSISSKKIKDLPVTSFENAIQGQLAGVQVTETSGEPGAGPTIRVRGLGSITAGNEPLYVVDGFPISKNVDIGVQGDVFRRRAAFRPPPSNPLATLNPNDISSIEVLKDASAAAIYGSRGSNGVILITTKQGKREGKPEINFDAFVGVQSVANRVDLMNAQELGDYVRDSRNNSYLQDVPGADINDTNAERNAKAIAEGLPARAEYRIPDDFVNPTGTDTDWQDEVFSNATIQNYNISMAGGTDNVSYYVSGGYFDQNGIIDGSGFDRYSFRLNLEAEVLPKLDVGVNLNPSFTAFDRLPAGSPYFARPPGIVYSALVHSPTVSPFLPDGSINQTDNQSHLFAEDGSGAGMTTASNPLAIMNAITDDLTQNRTFGNFWAEYELADGLKFKSFVGIDINNYNRTFFRANSLLLRNATVGEPYGQSSASQSVNWLTEQTLSYIKDFNDDHHLNAVIGYTAQKESIEFNQVIAENFPDDQVVTVDGGQVTGGSAIKEEWSLVSSLARANYSFKDKYLATATIRADRSSRFGKGNRTGIFPSMSLGWRISEEAFISGVAFLSDLKLRGSWGQTGNFLIPNYASIGLLGPTNYVLGGNIQVNGIAPQTISNSDLRWEKNNQIDIGLEIGLFEDRVFAVLDWYQTTTSDLLLNVQIPSALGFTEAIQNIGEVENNGFEVSLSTRNIIGAFNWNTDINFATVNNEVTQLGPSGDPILSSGGAGNRHITRIGDAIGSYFGYVVDGIYQDQTEIDNAPTDTQAPNAAPGDFRFKDVDGDGDIDPDDRTVIGNYLPDFTWGITNTFSYKGFDLSMLIQGVEGSEVLNLTRRHLGNGEANFNSYAEWTNRWRSPSEPGNGEIPRADRQTGLHGNNNRPSSFQVEDASYIRLRNITIGYNFPTKMLKNTFKNLRVYASGTNLFTSTDYLGYNPEVNNQSAASPNVQGEDYGAYPLNRVFSFGVNATF
ncbi:TonB-dependent receptor [Fulvivirga sp. M361]|uniref:SusC/RagA family TonB-linked outer membrane protein n=1 Tax=Fulvivirga sp. M361 TaxID=2594266 RepID=UPI00117B3A38|nr:TonB-dependent receptor [Fulvivirga sp. M361]TRX59941.1 TonB-dependent receptor [Fulvivirga sp. M361]